MNMKLFMLLLFIVPIIALVVLLIHSLVEDKSLFNDSADIKLTFKQFKTYYNLNPERYELCNCHVKYITRERFLNQYWIDRKTCIGFKTLIGVILYKIFYKKLEKEKQERIDNEKLRTYLEHVQEDIDKLRSKANNEVSQAKEIMEEVSN